MKDDIFKSIGKFVVGCISIFIGYWILFKILLFLDWLNIINIPTEPISPGSVMEQEWPY